VPIASEGMKSREDELEDIKQALIDDSREQFLPITKPAIIEGICELDGLEQAEQKKLCHMAHLLEALYHFEYHKDLEEIKYAYIPLSPESSEAEQYKYPEGHDRDSGMPDDLKDRVEGLNASIKNLLEKANFQKVSDEDLNFAMNENHVFDLPIEINWDAFDGETLIYARGRDRDIVEGKFTSRKLGGYLVRGSLGNLMIGLVLLGIAAFLQFVTLADGGPRTIVAGPSVTTANTLGPNGRTTFDVHEKEVSEGERLVGKIETLVNGNWVALPEDGSRGQILSREPEGDQPIRFTYQAPPAELMDEGEKFTLLYHWDLVQTNNGKILNHGNQAFEVLRPAPPAPLSPKMRIAVLVLAFLGLGGVLVGGFNFIRKRNWDEERRQSALLGDTTDLRTMTIERNRALNVDRFKDLFRKEAIPGDMFRQVVIAFKLKGEPHMLLKLFKDIPLADLELIFPNTRPRMKIKDRIMLLFTSAIAIGLLLFKIFLVITAAFVTFGAATLLPLVAAGGGAGRAWSKFKNTVTRYNSILMQSLYYKNLDNNFGVVHYLLDSVEEQELKEALLGYAFLYHARRPMTEEELDGAIEAWIEKRFDMHVDFEVDDAIEKMERYGIIKQEGNNEAGEKLFSAPDLDTALHRLDSIWDSLFEFRDENAEDDEEFAKVQSDITQRNMRDPRES